LQETEQSEDIIFEFDLQEEELAKAIFATQKLCVITQDEIEELYNEDELANFTLDSFSTDALPTRLNAAGAHVSDSPYLIADHSLRLKDISQRLRWSKEFKPLLHFGWRQVGITKNKAIPLKLFAGKHLGYEYQQALTDYQMKMEEAKVIKENLFKQLMQVQDANQISNNEAEPLTISTNIETVDNVLNAKAKQKQHALNELFLRLKDIDSNNINDDTIAATIKKIDQQSLDDILSVNNVEVRIDDQPLDISTPPKEPLQPWFLDGFFKVHLDRWLYITADFNVFNQNNVAIQNEGDEKSNINLINFNQNRRVITGEIHYFDHPYIGMVVQIRRFDPTKPADEAVTQAIK